MKDNQWFGLVEDLGRAVQVEVYGLQYKGCHRAPRARGYQARMSGSQGEPSILITHPKKATYTKPLAEIEDIAIWTDNFGPTIHWKRQKNGEFKRSTMRTP